MEAFSPVAVASLDLHWADGFNEESQSEAVSAQRGAFYSHLIPAAADVYFVFADSGDPHSSSVESASSASGRRVGLISVKLSVRDVLAGVGHG